MSKRTKTARDAFTFSLGGLTTIASFVTAPAIADDRLNRDRDHQLNLVQSGRDRESGVSLSDRRRAA